MLQINIKIVGRTDVYVYAHLEKFTLDTKWHDKNKIIIYNNNNTNNKSNNTKFNFITIF